LVKCGDALLLPGIVAFVQGFTVKPDFGGPDLLPLALEPAAFSTSSLRVPLSSSPDPDLLPG
jgi:hypothetical protein